MAASPRRKKDKAALEDLLMNLAVLDYPSDASAEYGKIRFFLQSRDTIIRANDLLIAAHVRHMGAILVTNNVGEFRRVPGLKIENWTEQAS